MFRKIGLILFLLIPAFISATAPTFDTSYIKWTMCEQFNLTRWDCDNWWETDTNPYYIKPIPTTNISMDGYYNKTQVETMFNEFYNKTEILTLVASGLGFNETSIDAYNKSQIDEIINDVKIGWIQNMSNTYLERDEFYDSKITGGATGSGEMSDTTIMMIFGGILILAIGGLVYSKHISNNPKTNYDNIGAPAQRKIQSTATLSLQDQIEQIKQSINQQQIPTGVSQLPPTNQQLPPIINQEDSGEC